MSTKQDVPIVAASWTNVHTANSLSAGTACVVQSKSASDVVLYIGTSAPTGRDGMVIQAHDYAQYDIAPAAGEYLFAKSSQYDAVLGVQV
jgi:hypothetical protein